MSNTENLEPVADNAKPNRRRKYIINAAFQWKYATTIAVAVFLISTIMSCALYGLLHHQARMRLIYPETYTAEVTLVMVMFALGFSLVTALGVGVWCVIVTHRMCGPLFVLENHLVELSRGRFPMFRPLRKKDEFKELYAAFSKAVGSLKDRKHSDLELLNEALTTARSATDSDGNTRTETLESLVKQINSLRDAAAEALGQEVDSLPAPYAAKSPADETMPAGII